MSKSHLVRLNVDITPKGKQMLEGLQMKTEAASQIEVIRKALALYDLIVTRKQAGDALILHAQDGTQRQIELL